MHPFEAFHTYYQRAKTNKQFGKMLGKNFFAPVPLVYPLQISIRYRKYSYAVQGVALPAGTYKIEHVLYPVATLYEDRLELDPNAEHVNMGSLRGLCHMLGAPAPYAHNTANKMWLQSYRSVREEGYKLICWNDGRLEYAVRKLEYDNDKKREFIAHVKKVRELIAVRANLGVFNNLSPISRWMDGESWFVANLKKAAEGDLEVLCILAQPMVSHYGGSALSPLASFNSRLARFRKQANINNGVTKLVDVISCEPSQLPQH